MNFLKVLFITIALITTIFSCGCTDSSADTSSSAVATADSGNILTDKELSELKWQAAVKDFTDRVESGEIPYSIKPAEDFIWILAVPTDINSYDDSFVAYYDVDAELWKVTELQNYPYGEYDDYSVSHDRYGATFKYVNASEEHTGYKSYYVDAYCADPTH